MSERAREAAAKAFHGVLFAEGVIIQTNALDAAIDAFLGALSETHVVVPRGLLEQVVFDGLRATDRYGLHDVCVSCGERPPKHENGCELAAIAATLKQDAGQ